MEDVLNAKGLGVRKARSDGSVDIEPARLHIEKSDIILRNLEGWIAAGYFPSRQCFHLQPVGGCTLSNFLDTCLVSITHVEHPSAVQQWRAELVGGLVPQLTRALCQPDVAGAFGISEAVNASAAGMAAVPKRRRELIETYYGKAAPGHLNGGETAHGPQAR